uniref:IPPc domain-containing protein n=1 Tax=Rhabditophanes sp. KR3021 TaxID=114890 RepID=A0AC35TNU4_9BILA
MTFYTQDFNLFSNEDRQEAMVEELMQEWEKNMQEMDLAYGAFIKDNASKQEDWVNSIERSFPNDLYRLLETVRLMGILLVVFKRRDSQIETNSIQTAIVPTGFFKLGNKGGVGISLKMNDSKICFINSHLAAGVSECERRNQDYRNISGMIFPDNTALNDHDTVFWLGDLNYRLETMLQTDEVVQLCNNGGWQKLLRYDQLTKQRDSGQVFLDYKEHEDISFKPTYKFDVGTSNWDSSEKKRSPAWTDRILHWKKFDSYRVDQLDYRSIPSITISDHKPVVATYDIEVKKVDYQDSIKVRLEARKEVDRQSNDLLPSVELSNYEFVFNDVKYLQPFTQKLELVNNGHTRAKFETTLQNDSSSPDAAPSDWLTLTPSTGTIDIKHNATIHLQALIDKNMAWKLSSTKDTSLGCIIVIQLESGRHYFITVQVNYKPSCFGISINEAMARRSIQPEVVENLIIFDDEPPKLKDLHTPYEMNCLIQYLRKVGLSKIDFDLPPSDHDFCLIRDCLDDRKDFDTFMLLQKDISPFSVYTTLLRLIESYKESIIPDIFKETILSTVDTDVYLQCMRDFPKSNLNIYKELLFFIHDAMIENNDFSSQLLMFADLFFRVDDPDRKENKRPFLMFSIQKSQDSRRSR